MATDNIGDDWQIEAKSRYKAARAHWSAWREEARRCFDYYAGHQWSEADIAYLREQRRPAITFNRIAPLVDAVLGHEANNRTETRYIPRTLGDAKVAEQVTAASDYFRDQCDAEHEESDAFRDALISGVGCTLNRLDDSRNPEFDLVKERVDPLEILVDPSSKKPNFDDRRYMFRARRFPRAEVRQRWPDFEFATEGADWDGQDVGDDPHDATPRSSYRGEGEAEGDDKGVLVVEYQWLDTEVIHVVTRPDTGETKELDAEAWKAAKDFVEESNIPHAQKNVSRIRRAFFVGDRAAQVDEITPKHWSYNLITGKRDRKTGMWFGIVRSLLDPQDWANKWLSQMLHIVNSNSKGGVMLERSATDDVMSFEQKWADPSGIVWFADGALKNGQVQPKPPAQWPAGVDKLLEHAVRAFNDVSGVNQELLGMVDRNQPGVLEYQRKQSAVTMLAPLFDALERYRKEDGRCWLDMMNRYVSDGRLIRITTDQGEQYIPLMRQEGVTEYDVIVDQAPSSPNQKEATWAVLLQLFPAIKDQIDPATMLLLLEYSPMPESLVQKLKEKAAQDAQKPPQPPPEMMKAQAEIAAEQQKAAAQLQLEQQKAQASVVMSREKMMADIALKREEMQQEAELEKAKAITAAQIEMEVERMKLESANATDAMRMEAEQSDADRNAAMENAKLSREEQHSADIAARDQRIEQQFAMLGDMVKQSIESNNALARLMAAPVRLGKNAKGEKVAERVLQ